MQPTDAQKFRNVILGMARMYGQEPDAVVLDAYWIALRGWDYANFEQAAAHLMQTAKFMPRPADFTELKRAGEPTAAEAWLDVLHGHELIPGSRTARAAAVVGGQYHVRHANLETGVPHLCRRFIQAYDELTDVDSAREALPDLTANPQRRISGPRAMNDPFDFSNLMVSGR